MNRFAFLPLLYSLSDISVVHEIMTDPGTGHIYIKGSDEIIRSKTVDLENITASMGTYINALETKVNNIYFRVKEGLLETSLDNKVWTPVSMTPTSILTLLKEVDGEGSGLDADLLDGKHASAFSLNTHDHDTRYLGIYNNAASASKWVVARSIKLGGDLSGTVSIDGSSDVTLTASVLDDSHTHDTKYLGLLANAVSSSKWVTPRKITLGGDLTGNVTIDGSKDVTLTASVLDDSHNHIIGDVDGLQAVLDNKLAASLYTAADILTKLKSVDGTGTGLDADLLDGKHASAFATASHTHYAYDVDGLVADLSNLSNITSDLNDRVGGIYFRITETGLLETSLDNLAWTPVSMTPASILTNLMTVDGTGSGLDADLLDGQHASSFSLITHDHNAVYLGIGANAVSSSKWATARKITLGGDLSGNVSINGSSDVTLTASVLDGSHSHNTYDVDGLIGELSDLYNKIEGLNTKSGGVYFRITEGSLLETSLDNLAWTPVSMTPANILTNLLTVDGTGSGLDADLLDGKHASSFSLTTHDHNAAYLRIGANAVSSSKWITPRKITLGGDLSGNVSIDGSANVTLTASVSDDSHNHIIGNVDGLQTALNAKLAATSYTASDVLTKLKTVDGSGTGLDADLLDGQHGTHYYRKLTAKTAGEFYTGTTAPLSTNRLNFDGYLYATRVYNAYYNDYAEYFEKGEDTEPGDIVMIDQNTGKYIKAIGYGNTVVRGVHSNEYGHCIGGDGTKNVEDTFVPIGLAGRVHVKLKGKARIGQNIIASDIPGVGIATDEYIPGAIIGQCEENKDNDGINKIKMFILRM